MSKFNIISLDGGGIKGLVSVIILQRLEKAVPGLTQKTELFAGTSTGGIVAMGMASGIPLDMLRAFYIKRGEQIFHRRWQKYFGLTGARYDKDGLKEALADAFADKKIKDLRKKILIPTFDLKSPFQPYRWKPKFFQNFTPDDGEELLARVALRTSSAPTYFKATDGFIDGGVVANNPAMCAVSEAINSKSGNQPLNGVCCLSVGTGVTYRSIDGDDYDFGGVDVGKLVEILIGGVEDVVDYQCRAVLGKQYQRVNPVDRMNVALDDVGEIPYLVDLAETWPLEEAVAWLKVNW